MIVAIYSHGISIDGSPVNWTGELYVSGISVCAPCGMTDACSLHGCRLFM